MKRSLLKTFLFAAAGSLALLAFSGCSEAPKPPPRAKIDIAGAPEKAEIVIAGKVVGEIPKTLSGPPGIYRIQIRKPGYLPQWFAVAAKAGETARVEADLAEQGSVVLINSRPDGAEIRRDGVTLGKTPLVLPRQPVGKHTVQVLKSGYAERSVSFVVADARPQEVMISLDSNIGKLIIDSAPSQARVFIDNRPSGYTPFQGELDEGRHHVKIEKTGFLTVEEQIIVVRDQTEKRNYKLSGQPGSIQVNSIPAGGTVTVDGKVAGVTPTLVPDVGTGEHTVSVALEGYDAMAKTVEIASGSRQELNFMLESSTGGIDLAVFPVGVSVYINGKLHGVAKASETATQPELIRLRNLAPGNYQVTIAHKLAVPDRRTVNITVEKGKVVRPPQVELWVPNVEVKWKSNGLVETGVLYAENENQITFGAERGVKGEYKKSDFEYIKPLEAKEKE